MKTLLLLLLHVSLMLAADPIITTAPITDITQNDPYFYEPLATDADGDALSWSVDAPLPSWLSAVSFVSTFAGTESSPAQQLTDGMGTDATFSYPEGLVFDAARTLYVADGTNYAIRRITPDGNVSTLVGGPMQSGFADGNATEARFSYLKALAIDSMGLLYVSDFYNRAIRRITPEGNVTTLATFDAQAKLQGIAIDHDDNLYVTDGYYNKIYKITQEGNVSTFAGSGASGSSDGVGTAASFKNPYGICIGSDGTLYVADSYNYRIRSITSDGTVTTLTGAQSGTYGGYRDGDVATAQFKYLYGIAIDADDTLYVVDYGNRRIRTISDGIVRTLAGDGIYAHDTGYGNTASFEYPDYLAVDAQGNLFVTENNLQVIRKIVPFVALQGTPGAYDVGTHEINLSVNDGSVSVPHNYTLTVGNVNDAPTDIMLSNSGIDENSPQSTLIGTLSALDPDSGDTHTFSLTCNGADDANFSIVGDTLLSASVFDYESKQSYSICINAQDANGSDVNKTLSITINNLNDHAPQIISTPLTTATQGGLYSYTLAATDTDGDTPEWSALTLPSWLSIVHASASMQTLIDTLQEGANALTLDAQGNLYISDTNFDAGYASIKKLPNAATLETLRENDYAFSALAVDSAGILYFADDWDGMIFRYDPQSGDTDQIDDGSFITPQGMAIDTQGNLYIADRYGYAIKKIDLNGTVTTLLEPTSDAPKQIAVDQAGNLFFSTSGNTVEKLDIHGAHTVLISSGLNSPQGVAVDEQGNLYIADTFNRQIVIYDTSGQVRTLLDTGLNYPGSLAYADGALYIGDGLTVKKYTLERTRLIGIPSSGDVGINEVNLTVSDGMFATQQPFEITVTAAAGAEGICGNDHEQIIETPHDLCLLGLPSDPLDSNATHRLWTCSGDDLNASCFSTKAHYDVRYRDHDDANLSIQSVAYDAAPSEPATPSRVGYSFTGWSETYDPQSGYTLYTATYNAQPLLSLPDAPLRLSAGFGNHTLSFRLDDTEGDPLTLALDLNNTLLDLNRTYSNTNASPATLFAADYTDGNLTLTLIEGSAAGICELRFIAADAYGAVERTLRIEITTQGEPLFTHLPSSVELGKSFLPYDLAFEIDHTGGDDLTLAITLNYPSMLTLTPDWGHAPLHVSAYRNQTRTLRLEPTEAFEGDLLLTFTLSDTQGHTIKRDIPLYITNPLTLSAAPEQGAYPLHVSFSLSSASEFGTLESTLWSPAQGGLTTHEYTFERPGVYDVNVTAVNTQGRSVQQSRTVAITDPALDRHLDAGWNYLSLPAYATLDHEALKLLFADPAITQVYTYTHEGWRTWQPQRTYNADETMQRLSYLHSSQGLLLYTAAATTLHFPIDTQHNRPDDFIVMPRAGWYLAGVNETKSVAQIAALVRAQGKNLRMIQLYVGTQLYVYAPDPALDAQILSTLPRIRFVASHQSFWVYAD